MTLQKHVNNSGFPLQLAIANLIRKKVHLWNVLYEEHNWVLNTESGFIDIVIEDQYKTWLMNIECKRVRDSKWIFLRDQSSKPERRYAKLWVSSKDSEESLNYFGWVDVPMDPETVQSSYCVVPGQDSKARPMLERIAANVVKSTEALALQESITLSNYYSSLRIYQNVIVTTAELYVCETDVDGINITTGELDENSKFIKAPYVRFRKQVGSTDSNLKPAKEINELKIIITDKESTIFIVNSAHFNDFLISCELPDNLIQYINR
jgi:hypothetical protein